MVHMYNQPALLSPPAPLLHRMSIESSKSYTLNSKLEVYLFRFSFIKSLSFTDKLHIKDLNGKWPWLIVTVGMFLS